MNFNSNCVFFIDESAFHINLKRTMASSKKGTRNQGSPALQECFAVAVAIKAKYP